VVPPGYTLQVVGLGQLSFFAIVVEKQTSPLWSRDPLPEAETILMTLPVDLMQLISLG
jgi:hypothetical protein